MSRSHRGHDSDSDDYNEITVVRTNSHHHHDERRGRRDGRYSPSNVSVNNSNHLHIPGGRPRASSTSAQAQPVIKIYNEMDRSPSRERRRPSRSRYDSDSSDDDYYRRHRRHSRETDEERKERLLDQIARDEAKKKAERERLLKEAEAEKEIKKIKDKEARDRAVAEWKQEEFNKKEKDRVKEKETEEEFEKRFRQTMRQSGVDEYQIDLMLERRKEKDNGRRFSGGRSDQLVRIGSHSGRPTFIKVARRHIDPRTLEHFGYNWHWENSRTKEHIIVEEWISEDRMEELFEHNRIYYTQLTIAGPVIRETTTTLRPNDAVGRDGDGLYLVRKRSTSARPRSRSRGAGVLRFLAS